MVWRAGRAALPFETQANVRLVTGYAAEAWTARQMPQVASPPNPAGDRGFSPDLV